MIDMEVYLSLEDLPVDQNIPVDVDASDPARKAPGDAEPRAEVLARRATVAKRLVVPPLKRLLKLGCQGSDVEAVQRALWKAGLVKKTTLGVNIPGNIYGPGTRSRVKEYQRLNKLEIDGVVGPETHKSLARAGHYDAYGCWLINRSKGDAPDTPQNTIRKKILDAALFGYSHRELIHYTMSASRMYGVRNKIYPPRVPIWEDCSSFATWCYFVAYKGDRRGDPNALGFNGYGYTGTLSRQGTRTSNPRPGDLGFYGSGTYSHVVLYAGNGKCVSHGSEGGPYYIPYNYRRDFSHWRSYV